MLWLSGMQAMSGIAGEHGQSFKRKPVHKLVDFVAQT
jgi:hypothetical protein